MGAILRMPCRAMQCHAIPINNVNRSNVKTADGMERWKSNILTAVKPEFVLLAVEQATKSVGTKQLAAAARLIHHDP